MLPLVCSAHVCMYRHSPWMWSQPLLELIRSRAIFTFQDVPSLCVIHWNALPAFLNLILKVRLAPLSLVPLLLHLFFLVLLHHHRQAWDVLVCLWQQVRQTLVFLLVNQVPVPLFIFGLKSNRNQQCTICPTRIYHKAHADKSFTKFNIKSEPIWAHAKRLLAHSSLEKNANLFAKLHEPCPQTVKYCSFEARMASGRIKQNQCWGSVHYGVTVHYCFTTGLFSPGRLYA